MLFFGGGCLVPLGVPWSVPGPGFQNIIKYVFAITMYYYTLCVGSLQTKYTFTQGTNGNLSLLINL